MAENEEENVPKKRNLDYILDNLVGGGSWYQWTTLLAMAPLWISEWPMTVSSKPQTDTSGWSRQWRFSEQFSESSLAGM